MNDYLKSQQDSKLLSFACADHASPQQASLSSLYQAVLQLGPLVAIIHCCSYYVQLLLNACALGNTVV